ncbi:MAG: endolytic transglycosylase MltG [Propionibacteriaceae bacterium]|nr:endolytic transglycosylase MltG [Propionibacteriaceae bacterium]
MNHSSDSDGNGLDWKRIGYRARAAFAVVLSLAILVGGGWFATSKLYSAYMDWRTSDDYIGEGKDEVVVTIPAGASLTDIGGILIDENVIRGMKAFRSAVNSEPAAKGIQAGRYKLRKELPAKAAVAMLLDPKNRVVNRLTIIEGLRVERQWAAISKATGIPVEDLTAASTAADYGLPAWAEGKPEGFMFPDTYEIAEKPTANEIFTKQTAQFTAVTAALEFEVKAKELQLTPMEALTVASLVQAEVRRPEDMPMVARVIYNRLEKKMPLQFDSTVHYVINKYDKVFTTDAERATDSRYNTYLASTAGQLPPGPINSPGKDALAAAVSPADSDALYFVTVNLDSGETAFAATLEEHNQNVAKLHAWCKANAGKCA